MKRLLFSLGVISVASLAQPAAATIITPGAAAPAVFVVTGNPFTGTSPVTATIGDTPNVGGTTTTPAVFTDDFQFTIGPAGGQQIGTGSGSIVTSTSVLFSVTDLDLTSILVNGTPVTITKTGGTTADGLIESAGDSNVPIYSGQLNHIVVTGLSRGLGSFGGNLTFIPGVPEPGTWAMMLLGFGAIGFTMRKRKGAIPQLA